MPNENTLPTPVTMNQKFLAKAAGMEVELPTAITMDQMYLQAIAEGSGGGSGDAYTKAQTDTLLAGKADLTDGKVPASQLPSYVDDVLEYNSTSAFPTEGESGKIYVAKDTNRTYRWSGSDYVEISESLALGETSSTAYAGNKGKANADAIGTIANLTTTATDLVGAVNELNSGKVNVNGTDSLMTAAEHTKLAGIASGAEVNVQSDWGQTDSSADDYIKNKPTIPAAQVNADWNAVSGAAEILNKPTIPTVDQTYNSASTNAQSGTAVASAISGKISATDYATQNTGGTVKAWTTTDGSDTILHLATQ